MNAHKVFYVNKNYNLDTKSDPMKQSLEEDDWPYIEHSPNGPSNSISVPNPYELFPLEKKLQLTIIEKFIFISKIKRNRGILPRKHNFVPRRYLDMIQIANTKDVPNFN